MKTSVPFKVALGYGIVATVLILTIWLVYANTQSLQATNEASKEYTNRQEHVDSLINLLIDKHTQLVNLSTDMAENNADNIQRKVADLHSGKDSIIVHPKTAQTHEEKNTVKEVVKTRKGFFNRLADVFKKQHVDTVSITSNSNTTIVDSIEKPVDVADKVATVLSEIEKEENKASKAKQKVISQRTQELKLLSDDLTRQTDQIIGDIQHADKEHAKQLLTQIQQNRQKLIWQIALLALIAIVSAIILLYIIWRDHRNSILFQESLQAANEEALRLMEQRERLLLTITHDIKAPAASISGFIDLLREHIKDPQAMACIDNIRHSSTHLSLLVTSLLDYHQLEKGMVKLHPTLFNPIELIRQCAESIKPKAAEKNLLVKTDTEGIQLQVNQTCQADAFRIRQILDNLVSNAIKYTSQGCICIKGKLQDNLLTLAVSDTGQGMTEEECRHIFQAFCRLKGAQGIEGVGLGLSITQELTTLLGGKIHIESEKGKGSTFTVYIPIELTATTAEIQEQAGNILFRKAKKLTNNKILLLDDDKLQLQLLQEMLRRIGGNRWQIFACSHISEALTILHNEHPTLMLLDIEMPEINGMDFLRHINHNQLTVIAMTAHDQSIKPQLVEAGFDGCLFKPFKTESLSSLLGEQVPMAIHGSNLNNLLAFSEGDPETAKALLLTVKQELITYRKALTAATTDGLDKEAIAKTAHKLLPIASMMDMGCTPLLESLSPEHIGEHENETILHHCQVICRELEDMATKYA